MRALLPVFLLALFATGCDSDSAETPEEAMAETAQLRAVSSRFDERSMLTFTLQNKADVPLQGIEVHVRTQGRASGVVFAYATNIPGPEGEQPFLSPGTTATLNVLIPGLNDPGFRCYTYEVRYTFTRSANPANETAQATGGTCPT